MDEDVTMRAVLRAFRLAIFIERDPDTGKRMVKEIFDITGHLAEGGKIPVLLELFDWKNGRLKCTGYQPRPALDTLLRQAGYVYERVIKG